MNVIVIGAGAAGLMAAKILAAEGLNVLVLEARERLGGRINTIKSPFSFECEAGAEFIHGNLRLTKNLLTEAGLKQAKVEGEMYSMKDGALFEEEDLAEGWNVLLKRLQEPVSDLTVKQFLNKYLPEVKYAGVKESFKRYVQGYDAANIDDASVFSIREEMENEDEEQFRIDNGYVGLINYLAKKSERNGCKIKTAETVKQINWQTNRAKVITNNNTYSADKILITVPIGVLRAKEYEAGAIKFNPRLVQQEKAINNIGFGGVIKILIAFDEAFWFDNKFLEARNIDKAFFFFADTFIPTWWTQYPDEKPLLVGWLAGPCAEENSNLVDEQFLEKAIASLSDIFRIPLDYLTKKVKAHKVFNWVKDPYSKGAYSYATVLTKNAKETLNMPVQDTIYFAGEALSDTVPGTVEAALQSGKASASKILKHHKRS